MREFGWVLLFLFANNGRSARIAYDKSYSKPMCRSDDFTCRYKFQCLSFTAVCDGNIDCLDGSDEAPNECKSPLGSSGCGRNYFQCNYGACILSNRFCDGSVDCRDGSDEVDCPNKRTTSEKPYVIDRCDTYKSPCISGECIDTTEICDGKRDCEDGSDETYSTCFFYEGFECPNNFFRCDYGACILPSARCNGVNDCVDGSDEKNCPNSTEIRRPYDSVRKGAGCQLERIEGTTYRTVCPDGQCGKSVTRVKDGESVSIECKYGYRIPPRASIMFLCDDGILVGDSALVPCQRWCPPLQSDSMDFICKHNGTLVDCSDWSQPGTEATQSCKQYFVPRSTIYSATATSKCIGGKWETTHLSCTLDCGRKRVLSKEINANKVAFGISTEPGEHPWYTALYKVEDGRNGMNFFCGGTIIAPRLVLTAAHCIKKDSRLEPAKPMDVTVFVGKQNSSLEYKDANEMSHKVKTIYMGKKFTGANGNNEFEQDIAVLELLDGISFNDFVQPACVDWKNGVTSFTGGLRGNIVGFGVTETGGLSSKLLLARLRYHSPRECQKFVEQNQKKISSDKFCAGDLRLESSQGKNVTYVLKGDSGGGLLFEGTNTVNYLYGILSYHLTGHHGHVSFYTNVSQYLDWMKDSNYGHLLTPLL